jgi:hypothetical protein
MVLHSGAIGESVEEGLPAWSPYRSRPLVDHRHMSSPAFVVKDALTTLGLMDVWRVDQTRLYRGGLNRRQRASIQGRWRLGRGPDRWANNDALISSVWVSGHCGSLQSLMAMELLRPWGRRR